MKSTFIGITVIVAVFLQTVPAQNLEPSIIGASGDEYRNEHIHLSWTIGEPVTQTLTGKGIIVLQGFQQPESAVRQWTPRTTLSRKNSVASVSVIHLHPNPAGNRVQILYHSLEPSWIRILTASGEEVRSRRIEEGQGSILEDLSTLTSGVYYVLMKTVQGNATVVKKLAVIK